jgi:DNA-binding transcriptional ArsR family regulator
LCEAWSDLTTWGDQFLRALRIYHQVFFAEEEQRIVPLLKIAREQAMEMAKNIPPVQLLETLSHGVHFQQAETAEEIILIPSYWCSPLVIYNRSLENRLIFLFGTRPEAHDLTPGETLPQDLVDTMKAIADPTRLRIFRYLSGSPQTPSQLARRLRLRPPTVIHHLNALRLVGLVEVIIHAEGERVYGLRREALNDSLSELIEFLTPDPEPRQGPIENQA